MPLLFCLGGIVISINSLAEQPGEVFYVDPDKLAKPYATESTSRSSRLVKRDDNMKPVAPADFDVQLLFEDIAHPRNMVTAENGDIFLAQSSHDQLSRLYDSDGDQVVDDIEVLSQDFDTPHGLAIYGDSLYVADLDYIRRLDLEDLRVDAEILTKPNELGPSGGHWTRNLAISKDGQTVIAAIGSRSNISEEDLPRAALKEFAFTSQGKLESRGIYGFGLRNPVGTAFHPVTDEVYTVVNERDGMGDGLVPDYFTKVEKGDFFGWPYAYIGQNPQPRMAHLRPDLVQKSIVPDVLFVSHSAPLGLVFLHKANVPEEWKDDALVALHGSWNAANPTGYKVVRVEFDGTKPTGRYINFLTGFRLNPDEQYTTAKVWGRPAGLTIDKTGAVIVSDARGGTIWRVSYLN
ncbi:PQQ-dependent sugar dehydrogenase [Curvivirga aplysinae]|uniref:PQQ-dependent sugar dehydrogenase n=1 Tax=Curvivirga aplysinae TaxID=2529852 RepID=UPI001C3FBB42|nr:PQQ-dependent sugar dehydrogenase [Curvivirga aplysinae]